MNKLAILAAVLLLFMGLVDGDAKAKEIRLSIGAGHPAGAAWVSTVENFFVKEVSRRVSERTNHEIRWTQGYGGSICKLGECLEIVEIGLLDMALIGTAFEPSKLRAHNFSYFVPFGLSDPLAAADAFLKVYEDVPRLKSVLRDDYNQVFIGVSTIGNYGLSTTFSWQDVDQLSGHKIAAAGPNLPWLEGTGIVAVQTSLNDAYTALETGVYEGWVMFADALISFKLTEVSKYFADLSFGCMAFPLLTINKDMWDELPKDIQPILLEVGAEWNQHNARVILDRQKSALQKMRETGVTFIDVSEQDRAKWAHRLPNLPKLRFEELEAYGRPGEAIYKYISVLQGMGHSFPRDWAGEK